MKKKILIIMMGLLLIGVNLYAANGDLIVTGNVGIGTTTLTFPLTVSDDGTNSAYFSGNVGIGTNSPARRLHVSDAENTRVIIQDTADGYPGFTLVNSTREWFFRVIPSDGLPPGGFQIVDESAGKSRMVINKVGYVGIGTETPNYTLHVQGYIYTSGYYLGSDERFKKDIIPIDSPLNKILNVRGISYNWKTEEYKDKGFSEGRHYGIIGQEIENVLPEIVKEDSDGYKSVSYTEIIPILIEAVKEQHQIIQELKGKVHLLEIKDSMAKDSVKNLLISNPVKDF